MTIASDDHLSVEQRKLLLACFDGCLENIERALGARKDRPSWVTNELDVLSSVVHKLARWSGMPPETTHATQDNQ